MDSYVHIDTLTFTTASTAGGVFFVSLQGDSTDHNRYSRQVSTLPD